MRLTRAALAREEAEIEAAVQASQQLADTRTKSVNNQKVILQQDNPVKQSDSGSREIPAIAQGAESTQDAVLVSEAVSTKLNGAGTAQNVVVAECAVVLPNTAAISNIAAEHDGIVLSNTAIEHTAVTEQYSSSEQNTVDQNTAGTTVPVRMPVVDIAVERITPDTTLVETASVVDNTLSANPDQSAHEATLIIEAAHSRPLTTMEDDGNNTSGGKKSPDNLSAVVQVEETLTSQIDSESANILTATSGSTALKEEDSFELRTAFSVQHVNNSINQDDETQTHTPTADEIKEPTIIMSLLDIQNVSTKESRYNVTENGKIEETDHPNEHDKVQQVPGDLSPGLTFSRLRKHNGEVANRPAKSLVVPRTKRVNPRPSKAVKSRTAVPKQQHGSNKSAATVPRRASSTRYVEKKESALAKLAEEAISQRALRDKKSVLDSQETAVSPTGTKLSVRTKPIKAPPIKQNRSPPKRASARKTRRARIDGVDFKIPVDTDDEEDFVPNESSVTSHQRENYGLRQRKKKVVRRQRISTTITSEQKIKLANPASLAEQAYRKNRGLEIVKAREKNKEKKALIVIFRLPKKQLGKKIKRRGPERAKVPKGFFTNRHGFKFGHTPFPGFSKVEQAVFQDVYDLLSEELLGLGISVDQKDKDTATAIAAVIATATSSEGPAHADDAVSVHGIINVIMSQATTNENAISAQKRMLQLFPCLDANGKPVGKVPDYHAMRTADVSKLREALSSAGLQNKRSVTIPAVLNKIRQRNKEANSPHCDVDEQPAHATTFFPGSLSLDYLIKLDKQEKFDELTNLPDVGAKSAACILAFCYRLPVFAVDTHVHRLVQWLGWVPEGCTPNDAFAHLDCQIPDNLKFGLHQAFWHHGQKCIRCNAKNGEKTPGWEDAVCSIEAFVKRNPRKERKSPTQKRKRESGSSDNADGPKPKVKKGKPMTAEEAAAEGYELVEVEIDDGFGVVGSNITGRKKLVWQKTVTEDDGTKGFMAAEVVG